MTNLSELSCGCIVGRGYCTKHSPGYVPPAPRMVSDAEAARWAEEGSASLADAWQHDKRHAVTRAALLEAIENHANMSPNAWDDLASRIRSGE